MSASETVQVLPGPYGGPSLTFEYREGSAVFAVDWDPRDSGTVLCVRLDAWQAPPGAPLDAAARERIATEIWRVASVEAGISAMLDQSPGLGSGVPVRWNRGDGGHLLNIHDHGEVDYFELEHALVLPFRKIGNTAAIDWPTDLRWTRPDAAISRAHSLLIRERVAAVTTRDLWIGAHRHWTVVIEDRKASPA